mmetsp:Transcript_135840/g.235657  ORF Transcript_135840/g.235657 Transcript_135840/m.235657 type:complete len:102 (-) Transcript_135840:243-548(-)
MRHVCVEEPQHKGTQYRVYKGVCMHHVGHHRENVQDKQETASGRQDNHRDIIGQRIPIEMTDRCVEQGKAAEEEIRASPPALTPLVIAIPELLLQPGVLVS